MNITESSAKQIDDFFSAIETVKDAYKGVYFTYVAIKVDGKFVMLKGHIRFMTVPVTDPKPDFTSPTIIARQVALADLKMTPRDFFNALMTGHVQLGDMQLHFPGNGGPHYSVECLNLHPAGISNQQRIRVLHIGGDNWHAYVASPETDWVLRAADVPYDNLQELLLDYGLGQITTHLSFETIAFNVAEVMFNSEVKGTTAKPTVYLADGLDEAKLKIGYRIFFDGKIVTRNSVSGASMTWNTENGRRGSFELEIPQGAATQCIASYDGVSQHFGWLTDPDSSLNVRRAAYEVFDPKFTEFRAIIEGDIKKGRDTRDLESAVGWLAWMLGFAPAHFGGTKKLQDAPDLIFVTPRGNMAVVECTVGLLKADNKLATLYERTQAIRKAVDLSGGQNRAILPVIITSKTRDEIEADLEQAERLGILVMTKEDLLEGIGRTLVATDADQLFDNGRQNAEAARTQRLSPNQLVDGGTW